MTASRAALPHLDAPGEGELGRFTVEVVAVAQGPERVLADLVA